MGETREFNRADYELERVASLFMLHAVQFWNQSPQQVCEAVNGALEAAGFTARMTAPQVYAGPDAEAAKLWLAQVRTNLRRGDMNDEIEQVAAAIKSAKALA